MPKQFIFFRDGIPENVQLEAWRWEAQYFNGEILKQFDEVTGRFHQFAEIDQSQLYAFRMVSDDQAFTLMMPEGAKLIHFYKHTILDGGGANETRTKMYCFGYELGNTAQRFVIAPDNSIYSLTNFEDLQVA